MHNKYTTVPRFLLAMECLLFIMRPVQIVIWCKLWELDFVEAGGSDAYANIGIEQRPGAVPATFPGVGAQHAPGGGSEGGGPGHSGQLQDGYRPFIVPEAGAQQQQQQHAAGDARYVPPASPPMKTPQHRYGE